MEVLLRSGERRCPSLLEDGAGEGGLVQAQRAPHLNKRRENHSEGEHPDSEYHEDDVGLAVDVVVAAVVSYQDVSVDSDGYHVHQGAGNVPIEEEGEDSAQGGSEGPGLVYVP